MEEPAGGIAGRTTHPYPHNMEISTKYKSLIQALDEQWNKIHEAKIKQLDTLNNAYNERLEEARKEYQRFTDSLTRSSKACHSNSIR